MAPAPTSTASANLSETDTRPQDLVRAAADAARMVFQTPPQPNCEVPEVPPATPASSGDMRTIYRN